MSLLYEVHASCYTEPIFLQEFCLGGPGAWWYRTEQKQLLMTSQSLPKNSREVPDYRSAPDVSVCTLLGRMLENSG